MIVGGGRVGSRIAETFKGFGLPLVVVELDHRRVESTQAESIPVVYGDASQDIVLEAATIHAARLLVVTSPDVVITQTIIANAKRLNQDLNVVARTSDPSFLPIFREMGVSAVVLPEFEASLEMLRKSLLYFPIPITEIQHRTESLRHDLFAPFFDGGQGYQTLVQLRSAEQHFDLQWIHLTKDSPLVDQTIGDLEIRKKTGASVVGVIRGEEMIANPDVSFSFQADDLVAAIGTDESREKFEALSVDS